MVSHHQQQQTQSSTNNNMPYNMHMISVHKNLANTGPSGGYHIQNLKEEPNTGSTNYPNIVNGSTQEDMAVSELFSVFACEPILNSFYHCIS